MYKEKRMESMHSDILPSIDRWDAWAAERRWREWLSLRIDRAERSGGTSRLCDEKAELAQRYRILTKLPEAPHNQQDY